MRVHVRVCDPIPRRGNLSPRHAFISCACVLFATCSQLASPCSLRSCTSAAARGLSSSGMVRALISCHFKPKIPTCVYGKLSVVLWRKCTCDAWLFPLAGYCKFIMWCRWGAAKVCFTLCVNATMCSCCTVCSLLISAAAAAAAAARRITTTMKSPLLIDAPLGASLFQLGSKWHSLN